MIQRKDIDRAKKRALQHSKVGVLVPKMLLEQSVRPWLEA